MNKNFIKSNAVIVSIFLGVLTLAGITFAAVHLSVSQQNIKTLHATFTYQDVIAAPAFSNNPAGERLLKIVNVPANVEILSAYFKIKEPFTDASSSQAVSGALGTYVGEGVNFNYISQGDLSSLGIKNSTGISGIVLVDDQLQELSFYLSNGGSGDFADLTSGMAEVYVNYLVH